MHRCTWIQDIILAPPTCCFCACGLVHLIRDLYLRPTCTVHIRLSTYSGAPKKVLAYTGAYTYRIVQKHMYVTMLCNVMQCSTMQRNVLQLQCNIMISFFCIRICLCSFHVKVPWAKAFEWSKAKALAQIVGVNSKVIATSTSYSILLLLLSHPYSGLSIQWTQTWK